MSTEVYTFVLSDWGGDGSPHKKLGKGILELGEKLNLFLQEEATVSEWNHSFIWK